MKVTKRWDSEPNDGQKLCSHQGSQNGPKRPHGVGKVPSKEEGCRQMPL